MLRLTLRTLLAYLDDTLEPAQAREIGEKVAESEFAQETVERIKTVTRRRRLAAPPVEVTDQSLDPNTIAEYLDNVLSPDDVTELETAALENDVRLAEVAACHQILTLVLGEPAKVPPTANARMYKLVRGPESIPYRKPSAASAPPIAGVAAPEAVDEFHEHPDDDLVESVLGPRSLLWIISLILVLAVLGVSIYLAVPPPPAQPAPTYVALGAPRGEPTGRPLPPVTKPAEGPAKPPEVVEKKPEATNPKEPPPVPKVEPEPGPAPRIVGDGAPPVVKVPDSERRAVAVFDTPAQPLLFRKRETQKWERLDPAEPRVSSTDELLALPGFHPEFRLETGPRLQLWGNVQDLLPVPISESRVTLYVPPQGIDADLTLQAGRVFITVPKATGPVTVRVRLADEVWDVTLRTPDTEVAIDLIGEPARGPLFGRDVPEAPRFLAYLGVIEGTATVRREFVTSGELTAGSKWRWDSKAGKPGLVPKDDKDEGAVAARWARQVPNTAAAKDTVAAVTEMARRVAGSAGPFDVDFDATLKDPHEAPGRRVLATWMLAAVDSLGYLIDALEADAPAVRDAAARALVHWCAQAPNREDALAQVLAGKVMYTEAQRAFVVALIGAPELPPADNVVNRLFELLRYERPSVRELARLQLTKLDPASAKEAGYDALSDRRAFQAQAWERAFRKKMKGAQ
jgi:hypothetical protein